MITADEIRKITKHYDERLDEYIEEIHNVTDLILSYEDFMDMLSLRLNLAIMGNVIGLKVKKYDLEYKRDCMLLKKSPSYESLKTIKAKDEQVFLDTYDIKLALVDLKQLHLRAQDELNYMDNIISITKIEGVSK